MHLDVYNQRCFPISSGGSEFIYYLVSENMIWLKICNCITFLSCHSHAFHVAPSLTKMLSPLVVPTKLRGCLCPGKGKAFTGEGIRNTGILMEVSHPQNSGKGHRIPCITL